MGCKKSYLTILAMTACFSSVAQTTLEPVIINIDENTKNNTSVGQISFTDGQYDKTVKVEIGKSDLTHWVTNGEGFEPISFSSEFEHAPIMFGQIQTGSQYQIAYSVSTSSHQGGVSALGQEFIMRHRLNNVTSTGFDAVLESELDKRGTSVVTSIDNTGKGETLGWLAVSEPVEAVLYDKKITVLSTGENVTHHEYGQAFGSAFVDVPNLITTISTFNGTSQSGVTVTDNNANRAKFFIDNLDDESHNAENVNVLAVEEEAFFATATNAVFGESGSAIVNDTAMDEPFTITLKKAYNDPVVFVQAVGIDSALYDSAIRLTDVSNQTFSGYLHNDAESVAPKRYGTFTLHYQVFEAGTWEMPLEHYQYSIVSGNENGTFSVDPISGKIKVADQTQLDFESGLNQFVFTVRVTDGVGNAYDTLVTVNVNDINDSLNNDAQTIAGLATDDWSGFGLAPAGDVNGDGFDDVIVGVPQDDTNGEDAGRAYVLFSNASGLLPDFTSVLAGNGGFVINGAAEGDNAGFSVNGGADINGDGLSDIVIGAPFADNNGNNSGTVYVVFGKANTSAVELGALNQGISPLGYAIHGAYKHDYVGGSVLIGDVNGDGLADIIAGETQTRFVVGQEVISISDSFDGNSNYDDPHMAYVIYGKSDLSTQYLAEIALDTNTSGFVIKDDGRAPFNDWPFGALVMPSGDFNSDGLTDVIVSHGILGRESGVNKLLFGRVGGTAIDYGSIAKDNQGVNIVAQNAGNYGFASNLSSITVTPGFVTSNVGDINADGIDDIALLAPDNNCCNSWEHPRAYIIFGTLANVDINLADIADGNGGFVIHNDASNIEFNALQIVIGSIGGAGDLNGDGYDDIIIGDPFAEDNKGRVYAVYGSKQTDPIYLSEVIETSRGFYSTGNGGEMLGQWIASAGDINGDGIKDIQFGTPSSDKNNLTNNGAIYVLQGNGEAVSATGWGSDSDDTFSGSSAAQNYATGLGNDTVAGKGGADAIYTGPGDDTIIIADADFIRIDGGGGTDTLVLDGAGINLNLMEGASKVRSVEVFDIRGSGANVISLNKSVSSNSNLRILGDADDSVYAANNQWQDSGNIIVIDNIQYSVFTVGSAQMLVQKDVTIEINNDPSIDNQSFAVSEYTSGGSFLGNVLASANDVGDHVTYKIIAGNDYDSFVIDSATGALSISNAISRLDYEKQDHYDLTVQVVDTYGAAAAATVTVSVNDVEFITHSFNADLSATESTFGSTAFTDILQVATMNEIASPEFNTGDVPEIPSVPDDYLPPGFSTMNPSNWKKQVDNMTAGVTGVFDMNLGGDFFFEPRFSMQTGQVISDIPVSMDLAYADEIQVGQETLITAQVNLDNYASFSATSPAFDIDFVLGVKDLFFRLQSPVILDNDNNPLDKRTSLDEGSFTVNVKSDEIAVMGRHCINTLGQPACMISAESDAEQPLRISASIDAPDWFEQELYYKTSWKAWYYGASGQTISHNKRECREDFFYPTGEDLYFDYNFEMLDTFLSVHADIKQDFYLEVRPISKLTLEDGTVLVFKGDRDIAFTPELYHDVNNDGVIDANLTVNLYSVFYNDTKTSVGARLPFKLGLAEWNIQEAVCTASNIYLYQKDGAIYEKGQYGPGLDFEFGFSVEEVSLTEWKWDEAAETLASPFVKKSESVEPLPPYLYNDNEWLLAHEKISKDISFDLCSQEGACGEPILSYHNNAPQVSNVTVSGNFIGKSTVSANYDYSDHEGDAETESVYQWLIASDSQGTDAVAIDGETFQSYTFTVQDIGKYAQFCVKPFDGENYGGVQCSAWQKVASPFYKDFSILTGFGQAIELNGVDQSLVQETSHLFDPGRDSFTIEMWLNIEQFNVDIPINVLTFRSDTSKAALRIMPDGLLRSKTTDTTYFSTESVNLNTWHHVAITYDQDSSLLVIYLDGEPVISQVDTIASRDVDLVWGANGGQDNRFLTGQLDELRFWNVAKTQEEVKASQFLAADSYDGNLVSYFTFDQDTPDNITDLVGATQMSATNGASFVKHNTVMSFDGDGDYFNVGYSSDLNWGGESFTAQAWIYLAAGSNGSNRLIMNKLLGSASGYKGWNLSVNSSNNLQVYLRPVDGSQTLQTGGSYDLKTERWYHVAVTVDRENKKLTLYQNGNKATQANLGNKTNINSPYPLRLGAYSGSGVTSANFEGKMDDVAIWNRVLSQDEIQACMNGLELGCEDDLFLYYDFEDSSGKNKATDRFNGSAQGNAEYVSDGLYNEFTAKQGEIFSGVLPLGTGVAIDVVSSPSHGELTVDESTGAFMYSAGEGKAGTLDSFSYIVIDLTDGYSFKRIVNITIE